MDYLSDRQNGMFWELAADYKAYGAKSEATVACPLCLQEFSSAEIAKLSCEHIVPSKLGGRSQTLTCQKCNNTHGSRLDSHLVRMMNGLDALEGTGTIETSIIDDKGKITSEMLLGSGTANDPITINIVGQASNMDAVRNWQNSLRDGATFNLNMKFPFVPDRYTRAAFRAAFLSTFSVEGYEYALSSGADKVRTVICAGAPVLKNVVMEAFPEPDPETDLLVMPARFGDFGEYYVVLLRLKTKRTRYLSVLLPGKSAADWTALEALYRHAPNLRVETTPDGWHSKLYIRFGWNPMVQFQTGLRNCFAPTSPLIPEGE